MPFWYFFKVPELPYGVSERGGGIQLKGYLVSERDAVTVGTAIALVENHWAVLKLKANGDGIVKRLIFDAGAYVRIGDPIAVIGADGENIPYGKDYVLVEVAETKNIKPPRKQHR